MECLLMQPGLSGGRKQPANSHAGDMRGRTRLMASVDMTSAVKCFRNRFSA
jgi:hypothetical protein